MTVLGPSLLLALLGTGGVDAGPEPDHASLEVALHLLGADLGAPRSAGPAPLVTFPGWVELAAELAPGPEGARCRLRAVPRLARSWPSVGAGSLPPRDDWDLGFRAAPVEWGRSVRSEPPVARLRTVPGETLARATVHLVADAPLAPGERVLVDLHEACALQSPTDLPVAVGAEPVAVELEWDTTSPLDPRALYALFETRTGEPVVVFLDWETPPVPPFTLEPAVLDFDAEGVARVRIRSDAADLELLPPGARADLAFETRAVAPGELELVVRRAAHFAGDRALQLEIVAAGEVWTRLVHVESPWPLRLPDGRAVAVARAIPGETVVVARGPGGAAPICLFPDRFPGVDALDPDLRILGRERVPDEYRGELRIARAGYALRVLVTPELAEHRAGWRKAWE